MICKLNFDLGPRLSIMAKMYEMGQFYSENGDLN